LKAFEKIRKNPEFYPRTDEQKAFFITTLGPTNYKTYFTDKAPLQKIPGMDITKFLPKELRGFWVLNQATAAKVKQILIDDGFGKTFTDMVKPPAIVAILKVLIQWKKKGVKTKITDKKEIIYDAVQMDANKHKFTIYETKDKQLIVELETKTDDKVYITMENDKQYNNIQIIKRVKGLMKNYSTWEKRSEYKSVTFPMVDYEAEPDISYFDGMGPIAKAFLKVKYQMNEEGAKAQAAAILLIKSMAIIKKELLINKPFLLWVQRKGLDLPVVALYCTKTYWKNPGKIDFN